MRIIPYFEKDAGYKITESGCWLWQGYIAPNGYGRIGRNHSAHKIYYIKHKGTIPKNKQLDHLCNNRACVNPEHLELVSCQLNIQRGKSTKITQEIADKIRSEYTYGVEQQYLANKYKLSHQHISRIVNHKIW